jgi:hypothetical protein
MARFDKSVHSKISATHKEKLLAHAFLLILWTISPFAALFCIFSYLYFFKIGKMGLIWYIFLAALYPALINITKQYDSDLLTYSNLFSSFRYSSFFEVYENFEIDYLFHFINLMLAKVSGANIPLFVGFWTVFVYFIVMWTQIKCFEWLYGGKNVPRELSLVLAYTLFAGLLFGLSAHLMRSYPAYALLTLSICCWAFDKKYYFWLYIGAVLIHFSILLFLPMFLVWHYFKSKSYYLMAVFLVVAAVAGSGNILSVIATFAEEASAIGFLNEILIRVPLYLDKSDGQISLMAWARLGLFELFACYLLFRHGKHSESLQKFSLALLFIASLLFLFRGTPILLLRYFYFTDFLNVILLVFGVFYERKNSLFKFALIIVAFISPFKFIHDISNLEMEFINNSYNISGYSIFDFMKNTPSP